MLLAIDTCAQGTLALGRADGGTLTILGEAEIPAKRNSSDLLPALRGLLEEHGIAPGQLDVLVVTSGPGSFTGVRIGLSTVKGLAEALEKPVVAVSRLAVLAAKAGAQAAAFDASRGEFYFGGYVVGAAEKLLSGEEMAARARELGSALAVCEEPLAEKFSEARRVAAPTAGDALRFALPRIAAGDYDDPVLLDGSYLRRSDAEIFLKPAAGASHANGDVRP